MEAASESASTETTNSTSVVSRQVFIGDAETGDLRVGGRHIEAPSMYTWRFGVFQLVMLALFMLFVFLLPVWSWIFNDGLGEASRLCTTPASEITCGGGLSYTDVAERLGRRNGFGELVGCSCGEGPLRDWACPPEGGRFSISYFISTPPGTGAMAAFSGWPILAQWIHGVGDAEFFCSKCSQPASKYSLAFAVMWYSQRAFQLLFGLFLINTSCVQPLAHAVVVAMFIVALLVHFITMALVIGFGTRAGKFIVATALVGIVSVVAGFLVPAGTGWFSQHAFWRGVHRLELRVRDHASAERVGVIGVVWLPSDLRSPRRLVSVLRGL